MTLRKTSPLALLTALALCGVATQSIAAPTVTRLTPPSELFSSKRQDPIVARFLPGQRFDLQATIRPDDAAKSITAASFAIDGVALQANVAIKTCEALCLKGVPANAAIVSSRAISVDEPGIHIFSVTATQNDGQTVTAQGNFEIVPLQVGGQKVKNVIIMLGDGLGAAHRTAARIVAGATRPAATARRGPTRSVVSAPRTKS